MRTAVILLIITILYVLNKTEGLRCRTDEGLSHDEVKKITRSCMRRLSSEDGENYDEYENYDSNESNSSEFGQNTRHKSHSNNHNARKSNKNHNHRHNNNQNRHQNQQGYNGGTNTRNTGQSWDMNWGRRFKRQMGYPYVTSINSPYNPFGNNQGYDFMTSRNQNTGFDFYQGSESSNTNNHRSFDNKGYSMNNRGNNNFNFNSNDNSQSNNNNNRSCLMHCFFEEMKMTSNEGFPDRHKVLHVITEQIRDRELKDFYTDSIQECFHILDLGSKNDKCEYSKNLVTCLSERAKTNCDDWNGSTNVLFNN